MRRRGLAGTRRLSKVRLGVVEALRRLRRLWRTDYYIRDAAIRIYCTLVLLAIDIAMFALRVRSLLDVCVVIRSTQIYYEPRGNQERARTYRSWTDRACEWSRVSRPGTLSPPATCKAKERGERNRRLLVATSRDLAACSTLNVAATVAAI